VKGALLSLWTLLQSSSVVSVNRRHLVVICRKQCLSICERLSLRYLDSGTKTFFSTSSKSRCKWESREIRIIQTNIKQTLLFWVLCASSVRALDRTKHRGKRIANIRYELLHHVHHYSSDIDCSLTLTLRLNRAHYVGNGGKWVSIVASLGVTMQSREYADCGSDKMSETHWTAAVLTDCVLHIHLYSP